MNYLSHRLCAKEGHFYSDKSFQLSFDAMCLWADKFDSHLRKYSKSDIDTFTSEFKESPSFGSYVMERKDIKKVHGFISQLYFGRHFTATMAGSKSDFVNVTNSSFVVPINWNTHNHPGPDQAAESSSLSTINDELVETIKNLQKNDFHALCVITIYSLY